MRTSTHLRVISAAFISAASYVINPVQTAAQQQLFKLSGFVDASFTYDKIHTSGNGYQTSSYQLDQVEIDVEQNFEKGLSLRADVDFYENEMQLEQGYMTFALQGQKGPIFTFGKFNAPIGFEMLDPPDMFQYSHSNVFDFGLPTNLTGLKVDYSPLRIVSLTGYVVNGWDINSENNGAKTIGGRIGLSILKGITVGASGIYGPEQDTNSRNRRIVFDLDATVDIFTNLILGTELNLGKEENATSTGEDATWRGFLVMGHYDLSSIFGFTIRYDYFDDSDGVRTGTSPHIRQSLTIAPTFSFGNAIGGLVEYRSDYADKDVFTDGDGKLRNNNTTIAFELTFGF